MIRIITDARAGGANITRGYKWNIKVTQIDCVSRRMEDVRAPDGCLQYFTDRRGTVNRCEHYSIFDTSDILYFVECHERRLKANLSPHCCVCFHIC